MNEAVRFLEKYRKNTVNIEELPEAGKSDRIENLDLKAALGRLDSAERTIVVLRYFEEEKLDAIAWMLDMNVNTVKSRLYRAVDKLKGYMDAGGIGDE